MENIQMQQNTALDTMQIEPATKTKKKVLLVDDVELFIQLEKSALARKTDIDILTAYDGMEAIEIIQNEKPDLVFMDMFMPKMNGDECCRLIKNSAGLKHIPIIMVTHGGKEEDLERALDAGCDEIMTKPINRSLFQALAKKYLQVQARVEPRFSARLKVHFGTEMKNVLTDYTVNLNTGGLFLATTNLLSIGTEMYVEFSLPDCDQPIYCRARVAWINDPDSLFKPELPSGMGLQFIDITLSAMDAIRSYISKKDLTADW